MDAANLSISGADPGLCPLLPSAFSPDGAVGQHGRAGSS